MDHDEYIYLATGSYKEAEGHSKRGYCKICKDSKKLVLRYTLGARVKKMLRRT